MDETNFKKIKWGEIYYCDLGEMKGSVQCGKRPVFIVQTNRLNHFSPTVVVAVITSALKKDAMDTHILIGKECGLKETSMIMLEQLRTVDKAEEIGEYIGSVRDENKILEIKRGLKYEVGIPIKPKQERKGFVLSLCPRCRSEFMSVPENIVKRVDYLQVEKESCDKCQIGYGYDYLIIKKYKHNGNKGEVISRV